jgi:hypothetical protein
MISHLAKSGESCAMPSGSHPGECLGGAAAILDEAKAYFRKGWAVFLAKRTEADFQECRDQRDWTDRKYAMRQEASGCRRKSRAR